MADKPNATDLLTSIDATLKAILAAVSKAPAATSSSTSNGAALPPLPETCPRCNEKLSVENTSRTPTGKTVHIGCKVKPAKTPPAAPVVELVKVKEAGIEFARKYGSDTFRASLKSITGKTKISEIPEGERGSFLEKLAAAGKKIDESAPAEAIDEDIPF